VQKKVPLIKKIKSRLISLYSRMHLLCLIVVPIIVTSIGPFETHGIDGFGWQMLFWMAVVLITSHLGVVCDVLAEHWVTADQPILYDLVKVALMVAMFSPILWLLLFLAHGADYTAVSDPLILSFYVAVVSAGVCVLRRVLPGDGGQSYFTAVAEPVTANLPRLGRRLPEDAQPPILRLMGRDHFVDVVTAKATHTIRMRFFDAIDEMDAVTGHCTHRSHWVVQDAISEVEYEAGKIFLRLSNGDQVPISRKYKPKLQEAGIL
jgi:hypothetical protein